ncbi:glycosyltransferase family 4 protein [Corynebacterium sp. P5848]|nr:glycosyltransferase family 4 protein [Corynebacterium marambiense]
MLYVLTNSLPTTISGYSCRTHALLTALTQCGFSVAGATRTGYPTSVGRWSPQGIDVVDKVTYFRALPWWTPPLLSQRLNHRTRQLCALVDRVRPTLIQATTDWENGLVAREVARTYRLPWVYEMRGEREKSWVASLPADNQASAERSERFQQTRKLEISLAKDADAVVVLSKIQRNDLVKRGITPDRIFVVPNGIDAKTVEKTIGIVQARKQLGLPAGFLFGTITSVVDYEGLDLLAHCLLRLVNRGIDARLLVAGSGISLAPLRQTALDLGISERCIFPGKLAPDAVDLWYQSLDVFCMPRKDCSVTRSVTPLKSLAATAYGIPVIASDLPAVAEVVPIPQAGTRLPPGSVEEWSATLAKYAQGTTPFDPHAARIFARTRTWDTAARTLVNMYRTIKKEHT